MDSEFWHQKWRDNQLGFHESHGNALLTQYFDRMSLPKGARVFLPLCGKTLDIGWLLAQGHRVVGAELSAIAIDDLFTQLGVEPTRTEVGALTHCSANGIDLFVGDVFELTQDVLGPIDAIYDRAALVALPDGMRERYAEHLVKITETAPQLLLCFEYDQAEMAGPPFSVTDADVHGYYNKYYHIEQIARKDVAGGLKGICPAMEVAWALQPH